MTVTLAKETELRGIFLVSCTRCLYSLGTMRLETITRAVLLRGAMLCPECRKEQNKRMILLSCEDCRGLGRIPKCSCPGRWFNVGKDACPECGKREVCQRCGGTGKGQGPLEDGALACLVVQNSTEGQTEVDKVGEEKSEEA